MSVYKFKHMLNIYPPLFFAGVRIDRFSENGLEIDVSMVLRFYNRNYVGTQFGGSLYSMTDPFYMLMLMRLLGKDYIVWDKAASIEFVSPGRSKVFAKFRLTLEEVERIRLEAESGAPVLPEYKVEIVGEDGKLVAEVIKKIYVRKKKPKA